MTVKGGGENRKKKDLVISVLGITDELSKKERDGKMRKSKGE